MEHKEYGIETKVDYVTPPWAGDLSKDDFITYMPSYDGGKMLEAFEEKAYPADGHEIPVGSMTYYLFDPVKNGNSDANGKYPLLIFVHGATNALAGRLCIGHSGGEMFTTPDYQRRMGGAFIMVPLANEKRDEEGNLIDSWSEDYMPHLKGMIDEVLSLYGSNISSVIIGGGSSGGYVAWRMVELYPNLFAGCFPVSSGYMPNLASIKALDKAGIKIIYACGRHDEFGAYKPECTNVYNYIEEMDNGILYTPDWVRNGDGGVASLYFGIEMGQHCMIVQIQADLMFTDGRPYSKDLPDGITGWINREFQL